MGFHPRPLPWLPFQLESTGLGFDRAAGEHKVVRLFKDPGNDGQTARCEVCTVPCAGPGGSAAAPVAWRPCAGRVPPHAAGFVAAMPPVFVDGRLYWLLDAVRDHDRKEPAIVSLSMDAEQLERVQTPSARRICHLTDFDGCLCAVVDVRHEISKYVFFTRSTSTAAATWSVRCAVDLDGLVPRAVSEEFVEERDMVPLCSAAGGKVLLATGRHKVFAYDPGRRAMERVFSAHEFVDVLRRRRDALLRPSIVLHEERVINRPKLQGQAGNNKNVLRVKLGGSTVAKREVEDEHRDDRYRHLRDLFKQIAEMQSLPPHVSNSQPNYTT